MATTDTELNRSTAPDVDNQVSHEAAESTFAAEEDEARAVPAIDDGRGAGSVITAVCPRR